MARTWKGRWYIVAPCLLALALAGFACGTGEVGGGGGNGGNLDPFPDDPFGPDEDVCAEVAVSTTGVTPTVSLLIDQSGSMTENFGGQDRWRAVYQTLMNPNSVVDRLQGSVRFGLNLYTSLDGYDGPECPILTTVEPRLDNYQAIDQAFAPAEPVEDTPTGEAIDAVVAQLQQVDEPGPKIIVLGTDGLPDTCEVPDPQNGQQRSITAAQDAYDAGVETYVISVGDDVGEAHLQDMANAGAGLPVDGGENAEYYLALNPQELVNAFEEIIGGVTGCVFNLDGEVDPTRECDGRVALDGTELECGTDWRLIDEDTLELIGDACETVQDGGEHAVAAVFPCGAVIIE